MWNIGRTIRFNAEVYAFYSRLVSVCPEIDTLPEGALDDSPWACSMEVPDGHVVMAILRSDSPFHEIREGIE